MNKLIRFSGILGLVLFLFGVIDLLFAPIENRLTIIHLGLGLALIILWAVRVGMRNVNQTGSAMFGRTSRFTANAVLYAAVFIGLLGVINWFANRYDKRWDTTAEGVYSLDNKTEVIIKNLKRPLKIVGFLVGQG